MKFEYRYLMILGFALSITGCEPEIDDIATPDAGEVDFSTYVALGNSLTAGYTDGALYLDAQQNSYPAILAEQFREVGGGEFRQPLVPAGNGFGGINEETGEPQGKLELSLATGSPSPVRTAGDMNVLAPVSGSFNNFGVPGAKAVHLLAPGYGSDKGNPFFARFASSSSTTIVADAVAKNPTFFTLWIGNNDILLYAASGGEGDVITDPGAFNMAIDNIIASLQASNASIKGAIANIPDIRKIPYFTTVPWNAFVLESQAQVDQLNAGFASQIDPSVKNSVTSGVIMNAVTGIAVSTQIIPGVSREVVKQQIASNPPCNASPDPEACAEQAIGSGTFDESIEEIRLALLENYFLQEEDRDPTYNAAYTAIDNEVQNNQDAINQSFQVTLENYNAGTLPDAQQAGLTFAIDSVFNLQVSGLKAQGFYPQFEVGPNGFVVEVDEEYSPTGLKQITSEELMLLPFGSVSDEDFNPGAGDVIVPDRFALDASELAAIEEARTAYNAKLQTTAQTEGYAYVDFAGFLDEVVESPLLVDGIEYSTTFATGNVFSLDGIHLTQAGAALVANEFIQSINAKYNASIPQVANISGYKRVDLP